MTGVLRQSLFSAKGAPVWRVNSPAALRMTARLAFWGRKTFVLYIFFRRPHIFPSRSIHGILFHYPRCNRFLTRSTITGGQRSICNWERTAGSILSQRILVLCAMKSAHLEFELALPCPFTTSITITKPRPYL